MCSVDRQCVMFNIVTLKSRLVQVSLSHPRLLGNVTFCQPMTLPTLKSCAILSANHIADSQVMCHSVSQLHCRLSGHVTFCQPMTLPTLNHVTFCKPITLQTLKSCDILSANDIAHSQSGDIDIAHS